MYLLNRKTKAHRIYKCTYLNTSNKTVNTKTATKEMEYVYVFPESDMPLLVKM
jgi:hypothetical protein